MHEWVTELGWMNKYPFANHRRRQYCFLLLLGLPHETWLVDFIGFQNFCHGVILIVSLTVMLVICCLLLKITPNILGNDRFDLRFEILNPVRPFPTGSVEAVQ